MECWHSYSQGLAELPGSASVSVDEGGQRLVCVGSGMRGTSAGVLGMTYRQMAIWLSPSCRTATAPELAAKK